MILLVGLGNPGEKYARTRHNIGFMAVDAIAEQNGFNQEKSKHHGTIREGILGTEKALILKPMTYMNESGRAVASAAQFYKIAPADIIVFHDELDLAPGKIRVKTGGGHAGHNGLRSIHAHIGESYRRVRLGIGHPGEKSKVSGYVLHDFAKADQDWLGPLLAAVAKDATWLAKDEDQRFQSAVAQALSSAKKPGSSVKKPGKPAAKQEDSGKSGAKPAQTEPDSAPNGPFSALKKLISGS